MLGYRATDGYKPIITDAERPEQLSLMTVIIIIIN